MVSSLLGDRNPQIKGSKVAPIVVEEVESYLRYDTIDLGEENDDNRIILWEILSRSRVFYVFVVLSNPTPISFIEPRLELRDEDLKDKGFQIEDAHPNPALKKVIIREKDLNIDWTDNKSMEGANDEREKVKNDDKGVRCMFGS